MIPVIDALEGADPLEKRVVLLVDAPGCEEWAREFKARGWETDVYETGNDAPPDDRFARRTRQRQMRELSRTILRRFESELTLFIEDDTILPPNAWHTLYRSWFKTYADAVSGLQYGRHGQVIPGLWRFNDAAACYDPAWDQGTFKVDACGLYCLMMMSDHYARTKITNDDYLPVDICQTQNIHFIYADTAVRCGHLQENGEIL
jgi:hypothetical protein